MTDTLFFSDDQKGIRLNYPDLFPDLCCPVLKFSKNIRKAGAVDVFKDILASIICDQPVVLFDDDFSDEEISRLTEGTITDFNEKEYLPVFKTVTPEGFGENAASLKNWSVTLFTSGTTGIPKKITHSFQSITRSIKTGPIHEQDVWGFAFNPTHMAGLQVFFQAFLNRNPLVNLFNRNPGYIFNQVEKYEITHISATPTFYRLLLPFEKAYPSLKQLTSGGEKFNDQLFSQLTRLFPNAKITNVYASTEAGSLFAGEGESFTVKGNLVHLVKVTDRELLVHRSLMGNSSSLLFEGDWYHTGDLVEVIGNDPLSFRFLSRNNEMINIGGYKVDPVEIEETILQLEGIADVRVFAKKNSVTGNLLCCNIIPVDESLSEGVVRSLLKGKLQDFKIPRIIHFVKELDHTRTGKKNRN